MLLLAFCVLRSCDGSKNRNSITTFSVPDEPVSLSLGQGSANAQVK